jgi:hypothetical protein
MKAQQSTTDKASHSPTKPDRWQASKDFFPLLAWDTQHGWKNETPHRTYGLASLRDCGFSLCGFLQPEDIPECERLGLRGFGFGDGDITPQEWNGLWARKDLSDAEIDKRVQTMVARYGNSDAIVGYYLNDEPSATMFPALAKAVAAVRKYAPDKLAYINLLPTYADSKTQLVADSGMKYLEDFAEIVRPQFLSYDNYLVQYSNDGEAADSMVLYYRNLLDVRTVALRHRLPFWNVVVSNQIRHYTTIPSPANLALQAYTTLATGGLGVSWYKYYAGGYGYSSIDENDQKTSTWYWLREINRQIRIVGPIMSGLKTTGVYFSSPLPAPDFAPLPGSFVKAIKSNAPIMVGEFTDAAGVPLAMIVNLSLAKTAKCELTTIPSGTLLRLDAVEDDPWKKLRNNNGFCLTAGHGCLVKLS